METNELKNEKLYLLEFNDIRQLFNLTEENIKQNKNGWKTLGLVNYEDAEVFIKYFNDPPDYLKNKNTFEDCSILFHFFFREILNKKVMH